jgi:hypothetical protein
MHKLLGNNLGVYIMKQFIDSTIKRHSNIIQTKKQITCGNYFVNDYLFAPLVFLW